MGFRSGTLFLVLAFALGDVVPRDLQAQTNQCGKTHFENAEIREIAGDGSTVSIADCIQQLPGRYAECVCPPLKIMVPGSLRASILASYRIDDHIWLDVSAGKEHTQLNFLQFAPLPSTAARAFVLSAFAFILLGIAGALAGGQPLKLIVGQDNRYSNSKFQMALWFWILLTTYLSTIAFRVYFQGWGLFGSINIPQNLLVLSGLSALTYGGAKGITTAKAEAAAQAQAVAPAGAAIPVKTPLQPGEERFFRDLFQNDNGHFDFGDFQMLIVTLLAVGMYLVLVFHFLGFIANMKVVSLPDVDTTILASFGLGQGAYLTKKAAGDLGNS